jgi:hypothetical protein
MSLAARGEVSWGPGCRLRSQDHTVDTWHRVNKSWNNESTTYFGGDWRALTDTTLTRRN